MTRSAVNARYLLDPALHARAETTAPKAIASFLEVVAQATPRRAHPYDGRIGAELYDGSKRLLLAVYAAESGDGEIDGSSISLPAFPDWFESAAAELGLP